MPTTCVAHGYMFSRDAIYGPANWGNDCPDALAEVLGRALEREFEQRARALYGPSVTLFPYTSEVIADADVNADADRLADCLHEAAVHVFEHMAELVD